MRQETITATDAGFVNPTTITTEGDLLNLQETPTCHLYDDVCASRSFIPVSAIPSCVHIGLVCFTPITASRETCDEIAYTRRQINLYRMFFSNFSVYSQQIFMTFCMDYLRVTWRLK